MFTAQSGAYLMRIVNDDPDDDSNADLVIRANSKGSGGLKVEDMEHEIYSQTLYTEDNFNSYYRYDRFANLDSVNSGAARIITTLTDGLDFFEDHNIRSRSLTVWWQHDNASHVFSGKTDSGAAYSPASDTIFLDGGSMDDSRERWVVLHELGHHVADIHERLNRYSCSLHYVDSRSDPACAWGEGWADFVPHMVDNAPVMHFEGDRYLDLEQDRFEYINGTVQLNFTRQQGGVDIGHEVEGQVAAALWDMRDRAVDAERDRANGGMDDLALGDDAIMAAFKASLYNSFEEFYDRWEADRPSQSSRNVMLLHAMGFANSLNETFGGISQWTPAPASSWAAGAPPSGIQPPGYPSTNKVSRASNCLAVCTMTLKSGVNLAAYDSAELSLWRYVGANLDPGDYLRIDTSADGGSTWTAAFTWRGSYSSSGSDDGAWHKETLDLSAHLSSSDFKVRVASKSGYREYVAVDEIVIDGRRTAPGGDRIAIAPMPGIAAPRGEEKLWYLRAYDETGGAVNMSISGIPGFARLVAATPNIAYVSASPSEAEPLANHTLTVTATAAGGGSNRTASAQLVMSVAPNRIVSGALDSDRFAASLDGWAYEQRPDRTANQQRCGGGSDRAAYSLSHSSAHGGSAQLAPLYLGCWYGSAGASKSFARPASAMYEEIRAYIKARSLATLSSYNNLRVTVTDSQNNVLTTGIVFSSSASSRLSDTGLLTWVSGGFGREAQCPCKVFVHAADNLRGQYQKFYLDEVHVGVDPAESCGFSLAKSRLDFGTADSATRLSGADTQTMVGGGNQPATSVALTYTDWTVSSGGTYPANITEIRAPHLGMWEWTPLSGPFNLGPLNPDQELDIEYRINYGSRPLVDPGSMRQYVTYTVRCDASLPAPSGPRAGPEQQQPPPGALSLRTVLDAGIQSSPAPDHVSTALAVVGPADFSLLPGQHPAVASTLKADELFAMLSSNASRVVVTEKLVYERDIVVDWEDHPSGGPYKVVILQGGGAAGGSGSGSRMADAPVLESEYRFTGLEPSTSYAVRVGVRGDDSTQSTVRATTLAAGGAALPSGLNLTARLVPSPGAIGLDWTDANGVDGGRYGVVVSVGGAPFGPAGIGPGSGTSAEQAVRPGWLNQTITYKIFERIGPQRLYSNEASVALPAALEAPRNLRAQDAGREGGAAILVEWDHAPLSRHYILEARGADGSWERLSRTQANSYEHYPGEARGQIEYRVTTQLHSALSPPSDPLAHVAGLRGG